MTTPNSPRDLRRSLEEIIEYLNEPQKIAQLDELSTAVADSYQRIGVSWAESAAWDDVAAAARRYVSALQNWLSDIGEAMDTASGTAEMRPSLEQTWASIDAMKQSAEIAERHARHTARELRGDFGHLL